MREEANRKEEEQKIPLTKEEIYKKNVAAFVEKAKQMQE